MARILLLEDDPLCTRFVESVLVQASHTVVSHTNAVSALDSLHSTHFDLVISDVNIPGGISGFEFTQTLRGSKKTQDVPVIFFTARGGAEDVKKALSCGADDYMVKPVDRDILLSKVTCILAKKISRDFARKNVLENAQIECDVSMTSLSEAGITLITPFPLSVATKIHIKCRLFDEVGIGMSIFRVLSCHQKDASGRVFFTDACFIGLSESSLQKIRRWIVCNPNNREVA